MYNELIKRKEYLQGRRKRIMRKMAKLPKDGFVCYEHNGYYKWYRISGTRKRGDKNGARIYITKSDRKYAEQLAQFGYLNEHVKDIDNELFAIEMYLKHYKPPKAPEYIKKNDGYKDLVGPLFELEKLELIEWATNYKKSNYLPENLKYKALDGNYYRSKSEAVLATRLFERNIPFRYECELRLNDNRIVCPDFMIMHPITGEIFIWEHLGMMDLESYFEKNMNKLFAYFQNGFKPFKNLIITTEDEFNHLDIVEIDRYIDQFFGC